MNQQASTPRPKPSLLAALAHRSLTEALSMRVTYSTLGCSFGALKGIYEGVPQKEPEGNS